MSSSSRRAQQASADEGAERVLGVRKMGAGQQYEIKWRGVQETTWEAASRVRKEIPQLVQEFEQQQQPAEGATDSDEPMLEAVVAQPGSGAAADSAALQRQVAELALLVKQQAQRAEEQQQRARQQEKLIEQLRASPAHSPQLSAHVSPQRSPQQESRSIAAAAAVAAAAAGAAAAAPAPAARRKEPRLSDLAEYNGAGGDKLDAWLAELRRCARYYQLSGIDAVEFAVARLRDAADLWWLKLDSSTLATIHSVETLATAMRSRFQPVTTARKAREQLYSLQQGSRHIDDYIAEFSKLHAQVSDMAEPDARAQFMRGMQRDLANKLEELDWENMPLQTLIARAARVGARTAAVGRAQQGKPSLNQMDIDDGDGSAGRLDRIEAALNAMAARDTSGLGAKTQTHRGYTQERGRGGGRGGPQGGRGGRFGGGGPARIPNVPGVPAAVVEQRRAAGQCYRCGSAEHTRFECTNASSASAHSTN
jgi:hypothetical protein